MTNLLKLYWVHKGFNHSTWDNRTLCHLWVKQMLKDCEDQVFGG